MSKGKHGFSITVEDQSGYWQVYKNVSGTISKMGNIYPPGYELFGEVVDPVFWVADECLYGKARFQSMERCLSYLIAPRMNS